MKKRTLALLLVATIGTLTVFSGCGSKSDSSTENNEVVAEEGETEEEPSFGANVVKENPLTSEEQQKWDALTTDCSKVNWSAVYAAPDCEGLVVSEACYTSIDRERNHLVVAFTNLNDTGVKISFEGYAENTAGDVAADVVDSDVEIGPGLTLLRDYECDYEDLSGEIGWKSFSAETTDREYVPYSFECELELSSHYKIEATLVNPDDIMLFPSEDGYGCVIDAAGNILACERELCGMNVVEFDRIDSFDGKNEEVLYFKNMYKKN